MGEQPGFSQNSFRPWVQSCCSDLSEHGDHRELQLLCKWVVGESEMGFFFQLLCRQLEREKLGNGCIKAEPVLSSRHCRGWYSR